MSNVRQYPYLPEDVREHSVGRRRKNPIDPLQMYASGLIMLDSSLGEGVKLKRNARKRAAARQMDYIGGRMMMYSPLGQGSGGYR